MLFSLSLHPNPSHHSSPLSSISGHTHHSPSPTPLLFSLIFVIFSHPSFASLLSLFRFCLCFVRPSCRLSLLLSAARCSFSLRFLTCYVVVASFSLPCSTLSCPSFPSPSSLPLSSTTFSLFANLRLCRLFFVVAASLHITLVASQSSGLRC